MTENQDKIRTTDPHEPQENVAEAHTKSGDTQNIEILVSKESTESVPGSLSNIDASSEGENAESGSSLKKKRPKTKIPPEIVPNYPLTGPGSRKRYLALCFLVPFAILLIGFIYQGIFPFGDRQILVVDAWHQYYPFFEELHQRLTNGESLLFSFTTGMGTNFIAMAAYYLASPLNLLCVLVPEAFLTEIYALITLLKVGFAGLFMGIFLYKIFKRNDLTLPIFATCFGVCSYMMGYYWCLMWLDTVMLLPLLALGIHRLVTEGRFKLYTLILALSVAANYYIGFTVCLFTFFYFFVVCITEHIGFKKFFVRLGQIGLFSVIGLAFTAPITLTAYESLMNAYYVPEAFSDTISLAHKWFEILAQVLAFIPPTNLEGLPNFYCGFLSFLMLYLFIRAFNISFREKVWYILFLYLLVLSVNINLFNYIWHGLHYPNMLPYRFSFLFSFLLVIMAYKAYQNLSDLHWIDLIFILGGYGAFLYYSRNLFEYPAIIIGNIILFSVYVVLLVLYLWKRRKNPAFRQVFNRIIGAVVVIEFIIYSIITMEQVGSSQRSTYVTKEKEITGFLETIKATDDEPFYRSEFSTWYVLNGAPIYDIEASIAQFSSTANSGVSWALRSLGLASSPAGNRFTYGVTTPITNAFLNLRYIFTTTQDLVDSYAYEQIAKDGTSAAYKTTSYLPLGFMVNEGVDTLKTNAKTPFDRQNDWIKEQTGISGDVFEKITLRTVGHSGTYVPTLVDGRYAYMTRGTQNNARVKFNYDIPAFTEAYAYVDVPGYQTITYLVDNQEGTATEIPLNGGTVFPIGCFEEDTTISIRFPVKSGNSGYVNCSVYTINQNAYAKALETLSHEEILSISSEFYSDPEIADNPMAFQNKLLALASGVEGNALVRLQPEGISYEKLKFFNSDIGIYGVETRKGDEDASPQITFNYTMPRDGSLYMMFDCEQVKDDNVTISCGEQQFSFNCHYQYAIAAGTYKEGDYVSISMKLEESKTASLQLDMYLIDEPLFETALAELSDEPWLLTRMDEDIIEGTVTAKQDGYLYTSVPYEDGWRAYVDGERTETIPFGDNGFVMVPVSAGTHTVKLLYIPEGLLLGCGLFAGAALLFGVCIYLQEKKKKHA